ncbi:MAG: hypothetical protein C5B56_06485 [Proteobacteria bacterium]|nr:MAG: hypothetical protein C5B56_06485 [Pseudomonadota bacterium]
MEPLSPIQTAHLYLPLHLELLELLRSLTPDQWQSPTVCAEWAVRDIVAHLLDVDIRRLSLLRDGLDLGPPDVPIYGYRGLVDYLNRLNADWVKAARRMSPRVLIDLLALTGPQVASYVEELDPEAPARFSVAWAGEDVSPNWFDVGRDYTERWHHQQQIRDAVGAPGLTRREWLFPVLDLFMRSVPFTYRNEPAPAGTVIDFKIHGPAGGAWSLRLEDSWNLFRGSAAEPSCAIRLDQDTAWRMFTKGIPAGEAARRATVEGTALLARPFLGSLAVMA